MDVWLLDKTFKHVPNIKRLYHRIRGAPDTNNIKEDPDDLLIV